MAEKMKKRGNFRRKLAVVLLVLCGVLAMAVLTTMEDGFHFAALRRWLMYGDSGNSGGTFSYAADASSRYGTLGNGLLIVTSHIIQYYQSDGSLAYDESVEMTNPQISVGRTRACVCDVGGDTLYILDETGVKEKKEAERGLCFYSARMNDSGYLAVTEQKSGYKASVSVYDSSGTLTFHFDSYERYICDAIVTEDGRSLALVAMEPEEGVFASTLMVFSLDTEELGSTCAIRDGLVMELASQGSRLISLCDKRLCTTGLDGSALMDYAYGNLYLHDYALDGDNFCVLLLGRYRAGNLQTLTTFDLGGNVLGSLDLAGEVLDLAAHGDFLAVLYDDSLVVYRSDLTEYTRLDDTGYASQILFANDGSIFLVSSTSAWRFLP